jgi:hypothetical protein
MNDLQFMLPPSRPRHLSDIGNWSGIEDKLRHALFAKLLEKDGLTEEPATFREYDYS